ncbi:unnamed protein product [Rhizophagus irregularis]|nr:unnamed protein product [Rhizophagus irregularis]
MPLDFYFKGKGAETEFWTFILKIKEAKTEKLKSISKDMVFLNTSWIEFQRNTTLQMLPGWNFEALNRILKVQNVTRLPFQRKPKDKFWTPISKILGSYLKNF